MFSSIIPSFEAIKNTKLKNELTNSCLDLPIFPYFVELGLKKPLDDNEGKELKEENVFVALKDGRDKIEKKILEQKFGHD
eukprot:CAMPEP_0168621156 /NCGR_PEP_ID=MMETSP0449_2-20121227/7536_1 /TAXON_ID=1082188 /ORGANISM="Strombidium rassoulzadegani, Strain ras09" /LENGTH=79 /DNA_ID=CAMNT_0008662241 /DNA_START=178 /DNA_END=417 /DNA_ORIENTATION=-